MWAGPAARIEFHCKHPRVHGMTQRVDVNVLDCVVHDCLVEFFNRGHARCPCTRGLAKSNQKQKRTCFCSLFDRHKTDNSTITMPCRSAPVEAKGCSSRITPACWRSCTRCRKFAPSAQTTQRQYERSARRCP